MYKTVQDNCHFEKFGFRMFGTVAYHRRPWFWTLKFRAGRLPAFKTFRIRTTFGIPDSRFVVEANNKAL